MQCDFCLNDKFETIAKKDSKTRRNLDVGICCNCGLIQQTKALSNKELSIYYSHNYRKDYKKSYSPKKKHVYRAAATAIDRVKFLNKEKFTQGRLLDIGAGGGEFVYVANRKGFHAEGIEPNIGYSEFSQKEYGSNVITGEIEEIKDEYDVITIFHVLEHLPSPTKAFQKIFKHLNKKGILFVEVPWIEAVDASPHNIFFRAHIYYFSIETLIACASEWFEPVEIDTSNNLRVLFKPHDKKSKKNIPSAESISGLKERMKKKGWIEYIIKGKGYKKPFKLISKKFREKNIKGQSAKEIIDNLLKAS